MEILCSCGCGNKLEKFDKYGRPRKFLMGHSKNRLGKKLSTDHKEKIKKSWTDPEARERRLMRIREVAIRRCRPVGFEIKRAGAPHVWVKIAPGLWKLKHRHVMEKFLGRDLTNNEVVHHLNGNRSDNRPENLQLMSFGEHSSLHNSKRTISWATRQKMSFAATLRWSKEGKRCVVNAGLLA